MKTTVSDRGLFVGLVLLVAIVVAAPGVTLGTTIYVDDDNVGGPWDGSAEYPFRFIQDGVDQASADDEVYVYNGTYYEHLMVLSTTKLLGQNKDSTIIDGSGSGDVLYISADAVTVTGFAVQNGGVGVHLEGTTSSYIVANDIIANSLYGIRSDGAVDNVIYHNNFIDNGQNACDDGDNQWDSGYPEFGNYWSDYTGSDNWHGPLQESPGADGVGDEPFPVFGDQNRDRFPLISPWDGTLPVPPAPVVVHVDDDFEESDLGWGYCVFAKIQDAIDAVDTMGTVLVRAGVYTRGFYVDKRITIIGEDPDNTMVSDFARQGMCGDYVAAVFVSANGVHVSGFTFEGFHGMWSSVTVCVASDSNTFTGNKFISTLTGLCACNSLHNSIVDNIFTCPTGVRLEESNDNNVIGNLFQDCITGLEFYIAYDNQVVGNTFTDNTGLGINAGLSMGAIIYHNNFLGNGTNALGSSGSNTWDNGYPSGGNFWDDYTGSDEFSGPDQDIPGSDGIGDTPYAENRLTDNYPLMGPMTVQGDANGDDVVNIGDVIFLINYLYKDGTPPSPPSAGDCNCDGQVNLADVVYLINYLYRGGPPPGC